ncbi:MAG: hypothetical protein Q8P51_16270 [Ignavibacteria bacterium]|nr:hypothetical protein [Ignavibacteria bacterium]
MIVCLSCWDVFDQEFFPHGMSEGAWCPKKSCLGQVADIDECLIPAIQTLNEKGYYTVECCSGHFWDNDRIGRTGWYVLFDEWLEESDFGKLPDEFAMETSDKGRVTISRRFQNDDPVGLHMEILKSSVRLTEWARDLPNINDY